MPAPDTLIGRAPAKLNLVLEVLGRRGDGYHEVDTILQTLELSDGVTIRRATGPRVTVTGPFAEGTPADETNLAWKALAGLAEATGNDPAELSIVLDKRIPAAGGLGGGASNAATVLRLLQLWWPAAGEAAVQGAAAAIGSDETFFLTGGTARARGRGERVTPLPDLPARGVVLFVPGETLAFKTARMFAALGSSSFDPGGCAAAFVAGTPPGFCGRDVHNAFERVAFEIFPGLGDLADELDGRVGDRVRLAGAGPTLFWIGEPEHTARVARAGAGLPCTIIPTATASSLWRP